MKRTRTAPEKGNPSSFGASGVQKRKRALGELISRRFFRSLQPQDGQDSYNVCGETTTPVTRANAERALVRSHFLERDEAQPQPRVVTRLHVPLREAKRLVKLERRGILGVHEFDAEASAAALKRPQSRQASQRVYILRRGGAKRGARSGEKRATATAGEKGESGGSARASIDIGRGQRALAATWAILRAESCIARTARGRSLPQRRRAAERRSGAPPA